MSTNKTPNYALHSWLPSDEFHLTEINENFAALDAAIKAEAQAAAAGITALSEEITRLLVGTYQGNNSSIATGTQRIEVGVKPKAVIVMSSRGMSDGDGNSYGCLATQNFNRNGGLTLDDSGFTVINSQNISTRLNISGYIYCYLVFY